MHHCAPLFDNPHYTMAFHSFSAMRAIYRKHLVCTAVATEQKLHFLLPLTDVVPSKTLPSARSCVTGSKELIHLM